MFAVVGGYLSSKELQNKNPTKSREVSTVERMPKGFWAPPLGQLLHTLLNLFKAITLIKFANAIFQSNKKYFHQNFEI